MFLMLLALFQQSRGSVVTPEALFGDEGGRGYGGGGRVVLCPRRRGQYTIQCLYVYNVLYNAPLCSK